MTSPNLQAFGQSANPQVYKPLDPTNVYAAPPMPATPYGLSAEQLFFITPPVPEQVPGPQQVPDTMQEPVYVPQQERDSSDGSHRIDMDGRTPGIGTQQGDNVVLPDGLRTFANGVGSFFGDLGQGLNKLYASPAGFLLPGGSIYKAGQAMDLWGADGAGGSDPRDTFAGHDFSNTWQGKSLDEKKAAIDAELARRKRESGGDSGGGGRDRVRGNANHRDASGYDDRGGRAVNRDTGWSGF